MRGRALIGLGLAALALGGVAVWRLQRGDSPRTDAASSTEPERDGPAKGAGAGGTVSRPRARAEPPATGRVSPRTSPPAGPSPKAPSPDDSPEALHQALHETLASVRRLEDPTGSNAVALMNEARTQLEALEAALDMDDPRSKRTLVQATERLHQTEQWIARFGGAGP